MDGATFALLGSVLLGVIGGILIGYGWGRAAERERGWRNIARQIGSDPSQDAGA